jgi:hypothetical protein
MSLIKVSEKGQNLTCSEFDSNYDYVLDLANATGELNCSKINSTSLNTCLSETNVINTINTNTTNNANAIGEIAQDLTDVQSSLQSNINVITQLVNSQNATIAEQAQQIASLINSFNNLDNTVNSFNSRLLSIEGRVMTLEIGIAMGIIVIWSGLVTSIPISWQLCLLGDSQVLLSDGSIMEIQDIVNNKLAVEVVSYNESTGKLEAKKVINWFKNNVEDRSIWYKLKVAKAKGLGPKSLTLTKDHPVWVVNKGWTKTEYVNTGDKILRYEPTFTDEGRQAIIGMYLSDGYISSTGVFKISQGDCHKEYIDYLSRKLKLNTHTGINKTGFGEGCGYNTVGLSLKSMWPELLDNLVYDNKITKYTLEQLGPIGLAHWYMGDGNLQWDKRTDTYRSQFHTEGFSKEEVKLIADYFETLFGERPFIYDRNPHTDGEFIRLGKQGTYRLMQMINQYIIPSMQYKLIPEYRNRFIDNFELLTKDLVTFIVEKKAVSELHSSKKNRRIYDIKYDIEVEDNHSFIANGFLVHNCDGTNNTPDLKNRFVVSAGSAYAVNSTGGSLNHIHTAEGSTGFTALSTSQMPAHSHGVNDGKHTHGVSDPGHSHIVGGYAFFASGSTFESRAPGKPGDTWVNSPYAYSTTNSTNIGIVSASSNISIASTGGGAGHNHSVSTTIANASNLPPYYALAYIMKI